MALVCTFLLEEKTMPEFTTVSRQEAMLQTSSGRQKRYLDEYIDYITNLPKGQAGRLRIGAEETPATIRRRLGVAAKTLGIPLIIKRSGTDVYFWRENGGERMEKRSSQDQEEGDDPVQGEPVALFPRICSSLSQRKTEEVSPPALRKQVSKKEQQRKQQHRIRRSANRSTCQ